MTKRVLITGITGQDGSYLAEFLLSKDYEVHGLIRRSSTFNTKRIDHIYADPHAPKAKLFLHYGDITDSGPLTNLIYNIQPDEVYGQRWVDRHRVELTVNGKYYTLNS